LKSLKTRKIPKATTNEIPKDTTSEISTDTTSEIPKDTTSEIPKDTSGSQKKKKTGKKVKKPSSKVLVSSSRDKTLKIWDFESKNYFRLIPIGEAQAGTTFTNMRLGMYTCLGQLTNNRHSALWSARVQSTKEQASKQSEFFLYWYPQVIFQAYNATIAGGLFYSGTSAALGNTNSWMFQQTWGAIMAKGRWTAKLGIIYQTREAKAQLKAQRYGSVQIGYRIH
jgi:hypothetical protein